MGLESVSASEDVIGDLTDISGGIYDVVKCVITVAHSRHMVPVAHSGWRIAFLLDFVLCKTNFDQRTMNYYLH